MKKKNDYIISLEDFTLDFYKAMINELGLSKTWNKILEFITDKTIEELSFNKLLSFHNLGELYEIGLAHSNKIAKKDMGKYYTPQDVSRVMAELLLENEITSIADVGCGTGNLIIEVLDMMKAIKGVDPIDFILKGKLYLYDEDKLALKICLKKIDVLLRANVSSSINVILGDFLNKKISLPAGVSVITNPPYSVIKDFKSSWSVDDILIQAKDLYAGFINKITDYCANAVVVSPQSYLVAAKFSNLRNKLAEKFCGEIFSFDNVPGTLFNGRKHGIFNTNSANGVRASIASLKHIKDSKGFKLTHLIRFRTDQRNEIINLNFLKSKLGTNIQNLNKPIKAFKELEPMVHELKNPKYLSDLIEFDRPKQNNNYKLYVSTSARYFIVASKKALNRSGYFTIYAKNKNSFDLLYSLLNSSYAYMWWRFSDGGILFTKRTLYSIPYNEKLFEKIIELDNIVSSMIKSESDYVSYKLNAGKWQESIKFPEEFRQKINELLFPKYAKDMQLLHKNYEVNHEKK
ncbi:Probable type I restriction enzyme BthVORF4518P M protein [Metamycoplasma arthritidis]|uniref:site-specific DNA-methyltransferase (adenine-specific) n=1 Tax=Metamycoplasma arthritidis (strain 158L3-1) TaxID=243272 RepID=B3PN45_META1|nr:N-6 DNA methylase [Metamycoplasma arthritidis]ACF07447.1 methyltransferase, HsdM related [Metamycoplasma arthritidis 158L3-1]VEU78968.1 Probable type I restriction enzyme BthVORF4518P M protein [Metamycoplasma arthritidis]